MILGAEFLGNVDSEILHDPLKVLGQQLFLNQHQQSKRDLEHVMK